MTAENDFTVVARSMLTAIMEAGNSREGVLFTFSDKPSLLSSVSSQGFVLLPEPAVVPLYPKHVHALTTAPGPISLAGIHYDPYLSQNGNVAPELFKCLVPLRMGSTLVGLIALGRHDGDGCYQDEDLEAVAILANYVALAVHNHSLTQTLTHRVSENLRLLASLHGFYDNTLEAFAAAIDVKHVNIHGHSLRVGRYSAGIGEAVGMDPTEIAALRSAGYLHDIGKVAVDKRLFGKTTALDPQEFREMADHTVVGHQIVQGVQFPWPQVPEIVRWHHERCDGTGYPDALHQDELSMPVRIVSLADTLDAMTSERPYRSPMSLGTCLHEIVRLTPEKFDPHAVQGLLLQVRRDMVGSSRSAFLPAHLAGALAPADIDELAAGLQHKISAARVYLS